MSDEGKAGGTILVVGGGISGITTAVEAAETGYNVVLVEKNPSLGGRVAQLTKYFPKLCPPYCGLEINLRRIKQNPNITVYTQAEVESVSGDAGAYDVKVNINPRYVNDNCTACGKCADACGAEISNEFNFGMDKIKGAYIPHELAYPFKYILDSSIIGTDDAAKCKDACKYNAIDLDMKAESLELKVGSIVYATGWNPFDASKIENLDFAGQANVISNMQMERIASPNGPTGGKVQRPSDGKDVKSVAFVQCAGSRDENYLEYCSSICCLASMKQATYVREQDPDSKAYIFYIDIRAPGKYELFYQGLQEDENVSFIKGKVAQINEDSDGSLEVVAEDAVSGKKVRVKVDMAVLATGMVPATEGLQMIDTDGAGFAIPKDGIYSAGVSKKPMDVASSVQDATGAAIKAIQQARD
jgi:quinone-modifying oxidoreductase subunit QmoA